jgi:hypothetical protein
VPPTPTPTEAVPTTEPTPTPVPTQIPWDDPKSVSYISDNNLFLTIYQDFSLNGAEYPDKFYYYETDKMVLADWSINFGSSATGSMLSWAKKYKEDPAQLLAVSVGKEFTIAPISGGELLSVSVFAVNDDAGIPGCKRSAAGSHGADDIQQVYENSVRCGAERGPGICRDTVHL